MSDSEIPYDSDQEISSLHSKLLETVSQLDTRQRVKKPERSEPTLEVSEFHLPKAGPLAKHNTVQLRDLADSLGKRGYQTEIGKRLQAVSKKARVLPKPLEKPAANRIKRVVGFEKTQKEVQKWDAIISSNRTAEKLVFPLNKSRINLDSLEALPQRFRLRSELEIELAALEPKSPKTDSKKENNKYRLTLEEIKEKRKEAAHLRAQQSYKEAKARRQGKIKSKKFHRIQKKERVKQQLKEFEELQKTDPEAALEKLEQLDKARAEERMSLRHKSTGQWAKNKQVKAKYDKEARQELSQQLLISKELTQKVKKGSDSEGEDEEESVQVAVMSQEDKDNPWVNNGVKTEQEIDDFISSYRKFWDTKQKQQQTEAQRISTQIEEKEEKKLSEKDDGNKKPSTVLNETRIKSPSRKLKRREKESIAAAAAAAAASTSSWSVESTEENSIENKENFTTDINEIFDSAEDRVKSKVQSKLKDLKEKYSRKVNRKNISNSGKIHNDGVTKDELAFKNKTKRKPVFDEPMNETSQEMSGQGRNNESNESVKSVTISNDKGVQRAEIDPNKYINAKPKQLKTHLPDTITGGDEALDDSEDEREKHMIMSEAFADDDVVEEFRKEKEDEIQKSQPEDIELGMLPGWGSWGGKNIDNSRRKKRRLIIKAPKEAPRKDENKGDVVIIEEKDSKLRKHQVHELPYPFTTVKDFEASIRAPIGRNFVPENVHKKLIEPAIQTGKGQIIEPMDEDVLLEAKKLDIKSKRNQQQIQRRKKKNNATKH